MTPFNMGTGEILMEFVNDNYNPATPVTIDTELVRTEIIDSYSILELISFIETRFNVLIPDEEVRPDSFRTIDAMCALVDSLRNEDDDAA